MDSGGDDGNGEKLRVAALRCAGKEMSLNRAFKQFIAPVATSGPLGVSGATVCGKEWGVEPVVVIKGVL